MTQNQNGGLDFNPNEDYLAQVKAEQGGKGLSEVAVETVDPVFAAETIEAVATSTGTGEPSPADAVVIAQIESNLRIDNDVADVEAKQPLHDAHVHALDEHKNDEAFCKHSQDEVDQKERMRKERNRYWNSTEGLRAVDYIREVLYKIQSKDGANDIENLIQKMRDKGYQLDDFIGELNSPSYSGNSRATHDPEYAQLSKSVAGQLQDRLVTDQHKDLKEDMRKNPDRYRRDN